MNSYSTHSRWTQAEEKLNVFFKYDQYLYISVCLREPGKACCPLFLYITSIALIYFVMKSKK